MGVEKQTRRKDVKNKEKKTSVGEGVVVAILLVVFLPLLLLVLIGSILYIPIDYVKFKRSRYQKDFKTKYTLWSGVHADNKAYTAIKENDLPVEYIKPHSAYDLKGYFIFGDTLLVFDEPFFFEKEEGKWYYNPNYDVEYESCDGEEQEKQNELDGCLSVDEAAAFFLEKFSLDAPDKACSDVTFFLRSEPLYDEDGDEAVNELLSSGCIVLYEKKKLAEQICAFLESKKTDRNE